MSKWSSVVGCLLSWDIAALPGGGLPGKFQISAKFLGIPYGILCPAHAPEIC